MSTDVILPSLGESVSEATVSRWMKAIGGQVAKDEPLLEVSTDKVDTEIPAPVDGVLTEIRFNEDDIAQVGDVLAIIEEVAGEGNSAASSLTASSLTASSLTAPSPAPAARAAAPVEPEPEPEPKRTELEPQTPGPVPVDNYVAPTPPPVPTPPPGLHGTDDDRYVTPLVRKLATELGVDLSDAHGTGVGGRIRKQDLLDIAARPTVEPAAIPDVPDPRRGITQPLSPARVARADLGATTKLALNGCIEVDVTTLRDAPGGYVGRILRATAAALRVMGDLNASLLGDSVLFHDAENIGWVVDTPIGPLVPVVHDASRLSAAELAEAVDDLDERAAAGQLNPGDLAGGTFTVRDDGASGLTWATPAINRPQVAALSIGRLDRKATFGETGEIEARDIVNLTLSYDRRVVDPGTAAGFLQRLRAGLLK